MSKYEIKTQTFTAGRIVQELLFHQLDRPTQTVYRQVLDTGEQQTRQSLIALGWTPPAEKAPEVDELHQLAYVPGHWRCPKCGCNAISIDLNAGTGVVAPSAGTAEDGCPSGCGPMQRLTERQVAEELRERYHDLLYQVCVKVPGETRHDTAKRILQTEGRSGSEVGGSRG